MVPAFSTKTEYSVNCAGPKLNPINIRDHSSYLTHAIDPFLGIFVAMVFILEVKLKRPVRQFQASLTKLSALLQVVVQFRYNI